MKRLGIKLLGFFFFLYAGCGKSFLEVKSDVSLAIPQTLADYQGLLDNSTSLMNINSAHQLGILSADELDVKLPDWQNTSISYIKSSYIWEKDALIGERIPDWENGYKRIMTANIVLDALNEIPRTTDPESWDHVKGGALFFRAFNYYQLAQLFCKPFVLETATTDLGIPLRLEADITLKSYRHSVAEVYDQILNDLEAALELLPFRVPVKMRPSQQATMGLLSKVYLAMGRYEEALEYANMSLDIHDGLIDYRTIPIGSQFTFAADRGESNPEVIFHCYFGPPPLLTHSTMNVSEELLALYEEGDLRMSVLYSVRPNGSIIFRGSFTGTVSYFTGLTTSELFLIKAECLVRLNRLQEALVGLNHLLRLRYSTDKFKFIESQDEVAILKRIINERRKELAFRGVRWEDLRRYNRDVGLSKMIQRHLGERIYVLEPSSPRYVLSIPQVVIDLTEMPQNER